MSFAQNIDKFDVENISILKRSPASAPRTVIDFAEKVTGTIKTLSTLSIWLQPIATAQRSSTTECEKN